MEGGNGEITEYAYGRSRHRWRIVIEERLSL